LPKTRLDERVDESLQESFPASDSPAVHVSDEPPANAQAKWDAADAEANRLGLNLPTRR
jgi:hypothetical protein